MALTSFFFTFFKVFLNGFQGLLVASIPRLAERLGSWQAFFLTFFKVFLNPKKPRVERGKPRITRMSRIREMTTHDVERQRRIRACSNTRSVEPGKLATIQFPLSGFAVLTRSRDSWLGDRWN
jgi:hypothetical protein